MEPQHSEMKTGVPGHVYLAGLYKVSLDLSGMEVMLIWLQDLSSRSMINTESLLVQMISLT